MTGEETTGIVTFEADPGAGSLTGDVVNEEVPEETTTEEETTTPAETTTPEETTTPFVPILGAESVTWKFAILGILAALTLIISALSMLFGRRRRQ